MPCVASRRVVALSELLGRQDEEGRRVRELGLRRALQVATRENITSAKEVEEDDDIDRT